MKVRGRRFPKTAGLDILISKAHVSLKTGKTLFSVSLSVIVSLNRSRNVYLHCLYPKKSIPV